MEDFDLLIVGAGPVGCTVAERAASQKGWKSVIVERRSHLAGNCFDEKDENGILVHRFGPHYFRTGNERVYRYLSRFTDWIDGNYRVKVQSGGRLFPFPINLETLELFFDRPLTVEDAEALLARERVDHPAPANSEEWVLSRVGKRLYEAFYLGYTRKQWDLHPRDLGASVCGRIPLRLSREDRYAVAPHVCLPAEGYTKLFKKMTRDPRIRILYRTGFEEIRGSFKPRVATVYCGPLDDYFGARLGKLPWRSLEFEFRKFDQELVQPCVQINYPNEYEYTRSVEYKHVTGQKHAVTVVSYEYPKASGDPYYPVVGPETDRRLEKYQRLAREETRLRNVHFAGRLAEYRYLNMDEAIAAGLDVFRKIANAELAAPLRSPSNRLHERDEVLLFGGGEFGLQD